MPDVALDLGILQARDKPRACVEARALPNEDWVGGLVKFVLQRLERCDRVGIEVDCSCGAVFRLCEVDGTAVEMDLSPGQRVLLRQTHSSTRQAPSPVDRAARPPASQTGTLQQARCPTPTRRGNLRRVPEADRKQQAPVCGFIRERVAMHRPCLLLRQAGNARPEAANR